MKDFPLKLDSREMFQYSSELKDKKKKKLKDRER